MKKDLGNSTPKKGKGQGHERQSRPESFATPKYDSKYIENAIQLMCGDEATPIQKLPKTFRYERSMTNLFSPKRVVVMDHKKQTDGDEIEEEEEIHKWEDWRHSLVTLNENNEVKGEFELDDYEKRYLIGRSLSHCHVVLHDLNVSRIHTSLFFSSGNKLYLKTLSKSGVTYLSGMRISFDENAEGVEVLPGDLICIEGVKLKYVKKARDNGNFQKKKPQMSFDEKLAAMERMRIKRVDKRKRVAESDEGNEFVPPKKIQKVQEESE